MKSTTEMEIAEVEKLEVKENIDLAYWLEKYDISAEDIKNGQNKTGIYNKIVESYIRKAS
jgi:hypothetical protein